MNQSEAVYETVANELGASEVSEKEAWPEPQPLRRELPASDPFPIDALGNVLSGAVQKMDEIIQSPSAINAQSLLGASALAVQAHADIEIDGRTFPISENFITIAESGERKTSSDKAALSPHQKRQKDLQEIYRQEIVQFEVTHAAWKKTREQALSSNKNKSLELKKSALQETGPEPQAPFSAILTTEEPTYEGLVKALANGWPSIGIFSDEGGRFLGGYGMHSDNQLKTASGLSKLWDGAPITRTRGGDGNIVLYRRRVSVHLMVQPMVSHLLFGNELLSGQGFLSRCLVAYPPSNIGQRPYKPISLHHTQEMRAYFGRMMDILEAPLPLAENTQNELAPRNLPLSLDAKSTWVAFHDHIETLSKEGGELFPIKGLAAKSAEHAARLAGILALVDELHRTEIPMFYIESGIQLAQFYLDEALRLFNSSAEDPDLILAEKCLTWARGRGDIIALVDLYQFGPNPVRDKRKASQIISILQDHGWIRRIDGGATVNGKKRRDVWEVHP